MEVDFSKASVIGEIVTAEILIHYHALAAIGVNRPYLRLVDRAHFSPQFTLAPTSGR